MTTGLPMRWRPRGRRSRAAVAAAVGMAVLLIPGVAHAAPPNDNFASRITITSLPFTDTEDTSTATTEAGEPTTPQETPSTDCGFFDITRTVWYQYTPSSSGLVTADTFGSTYDTVIVVYTGTSLTGLTQVACDDQAADSNQSEVFFQATAGTTYLFQFASYFSSSGTLRLRVAQIVDKAVALAAKPKKVEKGDRTRLTATVTPCPGQEGDTVEFWRGEKRIAIKATDASCKATIKRKVNRTSSFIAVAPVQDNDDFGGTSKTVKVRVVKG